MYPRIRAIHKLAIRGFPDTCQIRPHGSIHQRRFTEAIAIRQVPTSALASDLRASLIQPFKENDMKVSMIALTLAASVLGSLAHAAELPAPADNVNASQIAPAQQPQWSANAAASAQKTRAQVRQELMQAENDGQLANLNRTLYAGS
jgi:hypothetical protein